MSAVLFIIATPIGNLDDISRRAIETLSQVDLIAAEDTRHSQHLLAHLGMKKKMLSLHEHNERERAAQIVTYLQQGMSVGLISDAGTPLISDPGYNLVNAVIEAGFQVSPIPGPSSIITALCAAGLPTDRFTYHGFLSQKNAERISRLESLHGQPGTHILLESTHRIVRLMQQLHEVMPDAQVVLGKELTKRHENFIRGSAAYCLAQLEQSPELQKGEFVVLLSQPSQPESTRSAQDSERLIRILLNEMPLKKAVKLAVEITGLKKNVLYQQALDITRESNC
jgi:16S rRNA (cytidine1402-2'-O)-methyltransferase